MTRKYEIQTCNICDAEYKSYGQSKTGTCKGCRNKKYQERYRELRQQKSEETMMIYPLGINEQKRRYNRLKKELDACQTREERNAFYTKTINEMHENGLWDYCMSKTDKIEGRKNIDDNGKPKVGRIGSKENEYPNTKEMPE
jgi:hypothetical protein